jgi:hypothetical protein
MKCAYCVAYTVQHLARTSKIREQVIVATEQLNDLNLHFHVCIAVKEKDFTVLYVLPFHAVSIPHELNSRAGLILLKLNFFQTLL